MTFTEDQKDIRDMVRRFAEDQLEKYAERTDKEKRYPEENIAALTEMGVMGIAIPEEYGGAGMDEITKCLVIMELAKVCASTAVIVDVHYLVSDILIMMANEEQKKKYLPMAADGKLGAFCLTEPGAGSDAGGLRTRAVKEGNEYVLNGQKCFITNCGEHEGDFFVVIALTDPEKKTHGGMTAFLIDRNHPGLSISPCRFMAVTGI